MISDVTDTTDTLETTITEPAIETTGTLETSVIKTTTTAAAESGCVPTQILANPSFDDNTNGAPWARGLDVSVSQDNPRSQPNFL